MNQKSEFSVFSETGQLKQVMLHRPGREIDRLTIDNMDELLFDDLLWLKQAQREHDNFADILRSNGTEVLYFNRTLAEAIARSEVKEELINDVFRFECLDRRISDEFRPVLMDMAAQALADHLIEGWTKEEVNGVCDRSLSLVASVSNGSDFVIHPIPNLYFQRDPAITVADGIILGQMTFEARRIEPLYWKYILRFHPRFSGMRILFGDAPDEVWPQKAEGGDILVLSEKAAAIGVSQRTAPTTVQRIGRNLAAKTSIKRIFAFEIPRGRYCMHLDTVFTMVDKDAFCIYPPLLESLKVWQLDYSDEGILMKLEHKKDWRSAVAETLEVEKLRLIVMNGRDEAETAREQWHDGCNTLAVAPGKVVTYNRNRNASKLLRDNGVEVLELEGPELGRGRGGPRCMSMPLNRGPVR